MSDIRKFINIVSETSAGSVGSMAMPIGTTLKRIEENDSDTEKTEESPKQIEVLEYGNWKNSALVTTSEVKNQRGKNTKIVKSVYGDNKKK
jgi:hypothetical protein